MMQSETKKYRVASLIRKVDLHNIPLKRWAVIKLLTEFPEAEHIRFAGKCDACKRSKLLMSFRLPNESRKLRSSEQENCGYYCPSCGFGNAGSRDVWMRKLGKKKVVSNG